MNIEANRKQDWMRLLLSDVKNRYDKIKLGGGKKSIQKQKVYMNSIVYIIGAVVLVVVVLKVLGIF